MVSARTRVIFVLVFASEKDRDMGEYLKQSNHGVANQEAASALIAVKSEVNASSNLM